MRLGPSRKARRLGRCHMLSLWQAERVKHAMPYDDLLASLWEVAWLSVAALGPIRLHSFLSDSQFFK